MLTSGALFELYGKVRGDETVATAGWFNIRLGFWCALPVAVIGLLGMMSIESKPDFKSFMSYHMFGALVSVSLFLGVLLLSRFRDHFAARVFYYLLLIAGMLSILGTGYFGGELVHRFGLPEP